MARETLAAVYFNRRMAALLGLGFASGLPAKLLGDSLDLWLVRYDYSLQTIGLTGLIGVPLAFNFVWAPLMDRFTPPWLGRRRGWLVVWQVALIGGLIAMALAGPSEAGAPLRWIVAMGLIVAFFSASQDVVADAYRTDVLPDEELGAGAAVFVNGYRLAMIASGGGAILLSQYIPWRWVYVMMAALMGVGVITSALAPSAPLGAGPPGSLYEAAVTPVGAFFGRWRGAGVAVLLFVVLFKLPDQMAGKMVVPFLKRDLGFGEAQIAWVREWLGLGFSVVGAFVGGGIAARIGVIRSLWLFGALQALSNFGYCGLAMTGKHGGTFVVVTAVESFCAGLVTAGFVAFLMSLCDRRYTATQFALFTSLMFGAGRLVAPSTGYLVELVGYVGFFALTVAAAAPALFLLLLISASLRKQAAIGGAR